MRHKCMLGRVSGVIEERGVEGQLREHGDGKLHGLEILLGWLPPEPPQCEELRTIIEPMGH